MKKMTNLILILLILCSSSSFAMEEEKKMVSVYKGYHSLENLEALRERAFLLEKHIIVFKTTLCQGYEAITSDIAKKEGLERNELFRAGVGIQTLTQQVDVVLRSLKDKEKITRVSLGVLASKNLVDQGDQLIKLFEETSTYPISLKTLKEQIVPISKITDTIQG